MTRALVIACVGTATLLVAPTPASARPLADFFRAGNEAGYRGDWSEAARHYEALVAARVDDPDVHFNLATAHAHAGELGRAVLGFERCLLLRTDDAAAAEGLAAARAALGRRRAEREGEATVQTRPPLVVALLEPWSEEFLAWLFFALDALVFALLAWRRYAQGEALRVGLLVAWPLAAFGGALALAAVLVKSEAFKEGRAGIVLHADAALLEGPTAQARERGAVHEAMDVRILEREGHYARVRVPGGRSGWMHEADVAAIRTD